MLAIGNLDALIRVPEAGLGAQGIATPLLPVQGPEPTGFGDHIDRSHACSFLALDRTRVDTERAASAVLHVDLERVACFGKALCVDRLRLESSRGPGEIRSVE